MLIRVLLLLGFVYSQCQPYRRPEWRSLSRGAKNRFVNAFKQLAVGGTQSRLHQISTTHINYAEAVHYNPLFLPWHRYFTHHIHQELRQIDAGVDLPYWDWTLDASNPHQSPVIQELGGFIDRYSCLQPPLDDLDITATLDGSHRCLRRAFDRGNTMSPLVSGDVIDNLIGNPDYLAFAEELEALPHALPHNNIGGEMRGMAAPNDPLFVLHHGMIDKIFTRWQARHSASSYNFRTADRGGNLVSIDSRIPLYNIPFRELLDTSQAPYCYTYDNVPSVSPNQLPNSQFNQNQGQGQPPFNGQQPPNQNPPFRPNQQQQQGWEQPFTPNQQQGWGWGWGQPAMLKQNRNLIDSMIPMPSLLGNLGSVFRRPAVSRRSDDESGSFESDMDSSNSDHTEGTYYSEERSEYSEETINSSKPSSEEKSEYSEETINSSQPSSEENPSPLESNPPAYDTTNELPKDENNQQNAVNDPSLGSSQPELTPSYLRQPSNPIANVSFIPGMTIQLTLKDLTPSKQMSQVLPYLCPAPLCSTQGNRTPLPSPIDDNWLEMMKYPLEVFRHYEVKHAQQLRAINTKKLQPSRRCKPRKSLKY